MGARIPLRRFTRLFQSCFQRGIQSFDCTRMDVQLLSVVAAGSVLSSGGSSPCPNATAEDWINMVNDFQRGALSSRSGISMIYGIDALHGHNTVYRATIFPHNVGLGVTRDPDLVKRIGTATALEVRATGISYKFALCIADFPMELFRFAETRDGEAITKAIVNILELSKR